MNTTQPQAPPVPRIISVRFVLADGRERRRTVRCPYYARDPQASLYGLQSRLADLTLTGTIRASSISVPTAPRHRKACIEARAAQVKGHRCECFPRWTSITELDALEVA